MKVMNFYEFWIQVRELSLASIKSRYRSTWAGFVWVVINPLLMFGVQSLVFKNFMRIEVPNYYLFLLGGLLPWIFITSTIQMATPTIVNSSQLLRSFKINPLVIIYAQVLDNFINFMASLLITLIPFLFFYDVHFFNLMLLPLSLIPILVGTLSISLIMAIQGVFFRDLNFILSFAFSVLFYLTPIFYPREFVPESWQWIIDINPFYYLLSPFRLSIVNSSEGYWISLAKGLFIALILMVGAFINWRRKQNAIYFKL
jgi:ABC-type polysaccharide/polyol phosphate export permease